MYVLYMYAQKGASKDPRIHFRACKIAKFPGGVPPDSMSGVCSNLIGCSESTVIPTLWSTMASESSRSGNSNILGEYLPSIATDTADFIIAFTVSHIIDIV